MKRDILEKPFEPQLIKSRRGHSGKQLHYVEGAEYIRKLNTAFDGEWSFDVVEYQILENDVVVIGKLSAANITKTAFGGSTITRSHQSGEAINVADDLKAAATDALKKASSLLGLGLHLYGESSSNSLNAAQGDGRTTRPVPISQNTANSRLTDRQLSAIMAITRSLGWSREAVKKHTVETFGATPEELSKADASSLITDLRQMAVKEAA